jgi:hypothetical protein
MVRKGHNLAGAWNKIKWARFLLDGCPMPSSLSLSSLVSKNITYTEVY